MHTILLLPNSFQRLLLSMLVLIVVITPYPKSIKAGTVVGGPILSNTTWISANSPYIVTANISVQPNVILTIDPGVQIRFDNGYQMEIKGTLKVNGNSNAPVFFTSNSQNPQPGDWDSIIFIDSSRNSYVNGCIVEYAGHKRNYYSARGAIVADAENVHLKVDGCVFRNNFTRGLYAQNATVSNSTFTHNDAKNAEHNYEGGAGLYVKDSTLINLQVDNNQGLSSALFLEGGSLSNSYIGDNESRGIGARESYQTNVTISGNTIVRNKGGGIKGNYGKIIIRDNLIDSNELTESSDGAGVYVNGGDIIVERNQISNNKIVGSGSGAGISAYCSVVRNNLITNNLIQIDDNYSRAQGAGLYYYGYCSSTNQIIANIISGNSLETPKANQQYGSAIHLTGYDVTVRSNEISGNNNAETTSAMYIEGYDHLVNFNTFNGNAGFDVLMGGTYDIDGKNNYWGNVDNVNILKQIYDYYDNQRLGKFIYVPYLQNPTANSPIPAPTGLSVKIDGTTAKLTWQASASAQTGWGYKVYYDTDIPAAPYAGSGLAQGASPLNTGGKTSITLNNLKPNTTYYFAITLYDNQGRESWYSTSGSSAPPPIQGSSKIYIPLLMQNLFNPE